MTHLVRMCLDQQDSWKHRSNKKDETSQFEVSITTKKEEEREGKFGRNVCKNQ